VHLPPKDIAEESQPSPGFWFRFIWIILLIDTTLMYWTFFGSDIRSEPI
jgi:hypothetical protein